MAGTAAAWSLVIGSIRTVAPGVGTGSGPVRADDGGVHAVGDVTGRGDGDAGEPGPGQAAAVFGEGGRPGDAADLAAALEPLGRGEVVIGEDVGEAQAAAWPQDAEALGEDGGPVAGPVDHAVGDEHTPPTLPTRYLLHPP